MLVTFSCPAYPDITMFGDVAVQLLKMMGHSGNIPGAILAKNIHISLNLLEDTLKKDIQYPPSYSSEKNNFDDDEPEISLSLVRPENSRHFLW